MTGRIFAGLTILAALVSAVPSVAQVADRPIYSDKQQSRALNAATGQARASLPKFWGAFDETSAKESFNLKVAFKTRTGAAEHIWVNQLVRNGDQISGALNDEPVGLPGQHAGSKVTFKADQISDWSYRKNGKLYGHFTTRILLLRMSPEEQAGLRAILSSSPVE